MTKLNVQQSLFQSSVSHDPSEIIQIWFGADGKNVLLLSMLKTVQLSIVLGNLWSVQI